MKRRSLIGVVAVAAGGGYAAATQDLGSNVDDISGNSSNNQSTESDPMHKTFGSFSGAFKELQWKEDGIFTVTISQDAEMDGFGVRHTGVSADDYDGYTLFRDAGQFGGEVTVDFVSELNITYPSRSFELVGLRGEIQEAMPVIDGRTVSVQFRAPKKAVPGDHFE